MAVEEMIASVHKVSKTAPRLNSSHPAASRNEQQPRRLNNNYPGGNVCPACARRAAYLLTIPTSARDLPSDGEGPPNRP